MPQLTCCKIDLVGPFEEKLQILSERSFGIQFDYFRMERNLSSHFAWAPKSKQMIHSTLPQRNLHIPNNLNYFKNAIINQILHSWLT